MHARGALPGSGTCIARLARTKTAVTTMQHGSLAIRPYLPGDETRILATFNLVFRQECGARFADRDLAYWRWQYLENPAGTQVLLAVDADGTVASQYAAIPQTVDTAFGPLRFVHVVDSMTHPNWRQGLHRESLFATLGRAFTADYSRHGNELGYGFPVRAAERIGNRLLDYRLLRAIDYLVRPCSFPVPPAPAAIDVRHERTVPREADRLWQHCLPKHPCSVRRDHAFLHWRYVAIPTRDDYEIVSATRGGQLTGLMVLRPRHELVPDSCAIVDWVCHDDDADTAVALIARACAVAAGAGRQRLAAVFAEHSPAARHLRALGAVPVHSDNWLERRLTYRITGPHVTPELLASAWRYAIGDTDLG